MGAAIIRTSDRKQFKECRQAWDWGSKIRSNLEPNKEAKHFAFGTAVHGGLEEYYNPLTWSWHKDDRRSVVLSKMLAKFAELYPYPGNLADAPDDLRQDWLNEIDLGKNMLLGYAEWAKDRDRFTPIFVEKEFEVPVPIPTDKNGIAVVPYGFDHEAGNLLYNNEPVVYQGRVDMLIEDEFGNYWIVDHKTAGQFGDTSHLIIDEQCGSYAWALGYSLGLKISGVIYNELRKDVPHPPAVLKNGTLSKSKSQNTTYELYLQAIHENSFAEEEYADILGFFKEVGNKFFRRTQLHRSPKELELLGQRIGIEAIDMLNNPSIYPNPSKMRCNGCAFFAPCVAKQDGSDYEWYLNDLFHVRESG